MAERWIFTKEQLQNTPSRKGGIDYAKELAYRQQAANLIQEMGQRLQVNQLCINTSIVYMHRFYMFQSFTRFHRNVIAPACLFLAAKVEEQLRKLEHVIKVARSCISRESPPLDTKTEAYLELAQELVVNENILLQSLGFDIQVDHPHTHVVKTCQLVRASKDLAQTSYFLATNSLHLTTMCLQYKPTVVACVCIHLASKWSEYEIAVSHEGKPWYSYVDQSVTPELLAGLTQEFLNILDTCPLKLKRKILTWKSGHRPEEEGGPPPEKRHKGEPSRTSGASTSQEPSTHEKRGEPAKPSRKSENVSKSHRPVSPSALTRAELAKGTRQDVDTNAHRNVQQKAMPNAIKREPSVPSSRSSAVSMSQSLSTEPSDAQRRLPEPPQQKLSFKDYKTYREHKEKQSATSGSVPVTPGLPNHQPENERRPQGQSYGGESHKKQKHQHQHGSSSSGDEKKLKREHERKSHISEESRYGEESLKVHFKKERSDEHFKVHIKKESGTHKIKPTGSPLKLTIKGLSGSESSPSKSEKPQEHRPESLKMKLSLKPGQASGHGERPSKHRRSESYTSSGASEAHSHLSKHETSQASRHSYSKSSTPGIDGNGIHDPTRSIRHSNSHHKSGEQHSRTGQEGKTSHPSSSYGVERGGSGSIFSPPPVHQNFEANIFNTGAMLLSQTSGSHRGSANVTKPGYGSYPQQGNMSSNYSDSYPSFLPDMYSLGDPAQPVHGLETNGGGMAQSANPMSAKVDLQQLQTNMQQLIGHTKSQIAQQMMQHPQGTPYVMQGYMGIQGYQSNPPLPSVPPPPPPPPEDPPQPPPPPPNN